MNNHGEARRDDFVNTDGSFDVVRSKAGHRMSNDREPNGKKIEIRISV